MSYTTTIRFGWMWVALLGMLLACSGDDVDRSGGGSGGVAAFGGSGGSGGTGGTGGTVPTGGSTPVPTP